MARPRPLLQWLPHNRLPQNGHTDIRYLSSVWAYVSSQGIFHQLELRILISPSQCIIWFVWIHHLGDILYTLYIYNVAHLRVYKTLIRLYGPVHSGCELNFLILRDYDMLDLFYRYFIISLPQGKLYLIQSIHLTCVGVSLASTISMPQRSSHSYYIV